jgi:uncharacterized protein
MSRLGSRVAVRLVILLAVSAQAAAQRSLEDQLPPKPAKYVTDNAAVLGPDRVDALSRKLEQFERDTSNQIIVWIDRKIPENFTFEDFAVRAFKKWGVGQAKKDNGAALFVFVDDRKLRIEVGYGLEGALTDITSRRIIDEVIAPRFKEGDFAGGISEGLTRMIGVIDGEPLPKPKPEASHGPDVEWMNALSASWPFILVGALFIGSAMRAIFGRLLGASAAGGIFAVLGWFIAGSLIAGAIMGVVAFLLVLIVGDSASLGVSPRGRRSDDWSSGWSSGGSSGWSSGSSSSDSDSGGGGGSFGGGGASGSW